jgi:hypothetical protein
MTNPGRDDLESFFKPSIAKIKQLLQDQVTKANAEMDYGKKIGVCPFKLCALYFDQSLMFDRSSYSLVVSVTLSIFTTPWMRGASRTAIYAYCVRRIPKQLS